MPGDRCAEIVVSGRVAVRTSGFARCPQCSCQQASPDCLRKQRPVGDAGPEIKCCWTGECRWQRYRLPLASRPQRSTALATSERFLALRQMRPDERAITDARHDEAFGAQSLIRNRDDHPGHVECGGKLATRRHAIARTERAVHNRVAHLPVDLDAEIPSSDETDVERHDARTLRHSERNGLDYVARIGSGASPLVSLCSCNDALEHERRDLMPSPLSLVRYLAAKVHLVTNNHRAVSSRCDAIGLRSVMAYKPDLRNQLVPGKDGNDDGPQDRNT